MDPRFGIAAMEGPMKVRCKTRMRALINKEINRTALQEDNNIASSNDQSAPPNKKARVAERMKKNFIFDHEPVAEPAFFHIDTMLKSFIRKVAACKDTC